MIYFIIIFALIAIAGVWYTKDSKIESLEHTISQMGNTNSSLTSQLSTAKVSISSLGDQLSAYQRPGNYDHDNENLFIACDLFEEEFKNAFEKVSLEVNPTTENPNGYGFSQSVEVYEREFSKRQACYMVANLFGQLNRQAGIIIDLQQQLTLSSEPELPVEEVKAETPVEPVKKKRTYKKRTPKAETTEEPVKKKRTYTRRKKSTDKVDIPAEVAAQSSDEGTKEVVVEG